MEYNSTHETKGIIKKPSLQKSNGELKVKFVDEVKDQSLAVVHEVESYKKFNQLENSMCSCRLL
jgi:hypothetical protein